MFAQLSKLTEWFCSLAGLCIAKAESVGHPDVDWTWLSRSRGDPSVRACFADGPQGRRLVVFGKEVPEAMCRALRAVRLQGASINRAAAECGVSASTLWRYLGIIPGCIDESEFALFLQPFAPLPIRAGPSHEQPHTWYNVYFD